MSKMSASKNGTVTKMSGAPLSSEVEEALGHLAQHARRHDGIVRQSLPERLDLVGHALGQARRGRVAQVVGQDLVQNDGPEVQLAGRQLGGEELGLPKGSGLERGHHHEGGAAIGQQPGHGLGAGHKPLVHGLEKDEELRDVGQELGPENPVRHGVEGLGRHIHHA
jgi:hypothetical protein